MLNKNLLIRSLSGALFVVLVIGSIFLSPYAFGLLFLIFSIIGTHELLRMSNLLANISPNKYLAFGASIITYISIWFSILQNNFQWIIFCVLLLPIALLAELYRKKETPMMNVIYTLFPALYISLPLALLNYFITFEKGLLLIAFFVTIWAGDTFAYIVGSLIGKHRLFERISPKKSWEGTIGSMVLTMGFSLFYTDLFGLFNWWQWMIFVVICLISGSYGDLVESLFKRSVGVKDSGKIMPGHGGVLDRFDAVLLASPFIFVFLQIISTKLFNI